jgi:4'-phosphopantetheinyl transferase EntD
MDRPLILSILGNLAGPFCAVEGGHLVPTGELYPDETAAIRGAVEARRREFRAGRIYARRALAKLGSRLCSIPVSSDRSPVWPDGIVGSITHTRSLCAAVVAPSSAVSSLGIDIEDDLRLDVDLAGLIATDGERERPHDVEATLGIDFVKLLFAIKEATYKAYYPVGRVMLAFGDVDVVVDCRARRFTSTIAPSRAPVRHVAGISGNFTVSGGFVFACAMIPRVPMP